MRHHGRDRLPIIGAANAYKSQIIKSNTSLTMPISAANEPPITWDGPVFQDRPIPEIYHTFFFSVGPTCTHLAATNRATLTNIEQPQNSWRPRKLPFCAATMAPAMGLPASAPKLCTAKDVPVLTPMWRISEIWAMSVGPMPMKPPELKPKRIA